MGLHLYHELSRTPKLTNLNWKPQIKQLLGFLPKAFTLSALNNVPGHLINI
jgi:hypothetical protein